MKKFEKEASFLLAIKLRDLNISLSNSIEMDKEIFINQFDLSSTRHCFKLLRCFGFSSSIPSVMILGKKSFHTDSDKALGFNEFFASVFNASLAQSAPLQCEKPTIKLSDLSLSLSDVRSLLECCEDSSAMGADGIPSFLLYQCSNTLCTPVFELFNWILKNQHWPEIWKLAYVTPLHKSGAHNDIANYRPISILPKISLILERIMFDYIYPRIRHLIKLEQHGFMKMRSTVSQMIMYLDVVYSSRDTNSSAVSIYFDIRKAFDSVPHHKLLSKLVNFGFDSDFLQLFHSYLTNRFQCVKINRILSSPLSVTSGVPQGSVLGPLLFLLFVNDIAENVVNSSYYLFADDLKIFSTSPDSLVQDDINSLLDWSNLNGLQFHPTKCKVLNFGSHDESAQFLLGAEYLPFVNQIEDLGFIVSSSLSWKPHVESKLLKCNRIFGFLKRSIPISVSSSRKLLLYKSLIVPILLYGAPAWTPSLTILHQLELFQYKVFRWITNCSSYVSGLQSLKMLPVCYCLVREDMVFLWKLCNGAIDVHWAIPSISLPTRSSSNGLFQIPSSHKISTNDNFFIRATRTANELLRLKIISFDMSLLSFKLSLSKYLIARTCNFYNLNNSCSHFVKCFCSSCRA